MKEKIEALKKLMSDLNEKITRIAKEQGQDDGHPKSDAIQKDELEKMKTDILDAVKSQNPPKKNFIFGGKKELSDNEQRVGFGEYLQMVKVNHPVISEQFVKTAMSEGTPAQGGYAVPIEYSNDIIGELNDAATIVPKCTRFPQGTNKKKLPKWLTDMIVGWVDELGVKTETKPTLTQLESVLKKMAAIVSETDEFREDETVGMDNELKRLAGENFALEIERVVLIGTTLGGDPFNGIYYSATAGDPLNQAGANLNYSDIVACWNNPVILEKYRKNPEWYMNRTALGLILNMVDGNGRPLCNITNAFQADKAVVTILGDKVNLSSEITNTLGANSDHTAIFHGNYKYVVLGEKSGKGGMQVSFSNTAIISTGTQVTTNYWTQDVSGWRFVLRRGVLVAIPLAFSVLKEVR